MFDTESNILVGPFTAVTEDASQIETGTWSTGIDLGSFSGNVTVEWEDLHVVENALERFPFLKDFKTCEIPSLKVQELLETLKKAPPYQGEEIAPSYP